MDLEFRFFGPFGLCQFLSAAALLGETHLEHVPRKSGLGTTLQDSLRK